MTHDPRETAARWFARERSGGMDQFECREFEAWRNANAENAREYLAMESIWETARDVPEERLRALAAAPRRSSRSWQFVGLAATFLIVVAVGAGAWRWHLAQPVFTAAFGTAWGERKHVELPDRSGIDVNVRTRIEVAYFRDRRSVVLAAGEASFSVDPDPARPFVVEAGKASVRVTGTRFNVRRDGDGVSVSVLSGTVKVSGIASASVASLASGEGVRVDARGEIGEVLCIDVAALSAWREGKLVFDDTPLAEVLREVARYRARPIRLAEPELARLRMSGVFSVADTDALLAALPRILPVEVRTLPDGGAEIVRH